MRIENYNDYEVMATPLANRDDRVWDAGHNKVTTDSYSLSIGKEKVTKKPYILVTHGAGSEAIAIESSYCSLPVLLELARSNERACYGLLFTIYQTASYSRRAGADEATQTYRRAFADGTLKKRKMRGSGAVKVWIEDKAA